MSALIRECQFDYAAVDASAAELARAAAEKIHRHQHRVVAEILDIGADLQHVKDALGHGNFGPWLDSEFGWTERTAQRYMQAAAILGTKSDTVSELPPTIIYKLAAPSTPENIRNDIVCRLEHGDQLPPDQITKLISDARRQEKKAIEDARLTPPQRRYRAKKKAEREQEKQKAEEERRQREERARAAAQEVVDRFGVATIRAILKATDHWEVRRALEAIVLERVS